MKITAGRHAGRRGSVPRIHAQAACVKHAAVRPGTVIRIFLDDGKLAARRFMGGFARANGKVHGRLAVNPQHAPLIIQMNDDSAVPRPRLLDAFVMIPDIAREDGTGGPRQKLHRKTHTCRLSSTAFRERVLGVEEQADKNRETHRKKRKAGRVCGMRPALPSSPWKSSTIPLRSFMFGGILIETPFFSV